MKCMESGREGRSHDPNLQQACVNTLSEQRLKNVVPSKVQCRNHGIVTQNLQTSHLNELEQGVVPANIPWRMRITTRVTAFLASLAGSPSSKNHTVPRSLRTLKLIPMFSRGYHKTRHLYSLKTSRTQTGEAVTAFARLLDHSRPSVSNCMKHHHGNRQR